MAKKNTIKKGHPGIPKKESLGAPKKGPLGTPLGNPIGYFNTSKPVLKKAQNGQEVGPKKITATADWAKEANKSGKHWYLMTDQQRKDFKTNYYKPKETVKPAEVVKKEEPKITPSSSKSSTLFTTLGTIGPAMSTYTMKPKKQQLIKYKKTKKKEEKVAEPAKPVHRAMYDVGSMERTVRSPKTVEKKASSNKEIKKVKDISEKRHQRIEKRYAKAGNKFNISGDTITRENKKGTKAISQEFYKKGGSVKSKRKK